MYKPETIRKYAAKVREIREKILADGIENYHVFVSERNDKVPCRNVATLPIFDCPNNRGCNRFCYDIKAAVRFVDNVLFKRVVNSMILELDPERYFREVEESMQYQLFYRWHEAGDIKNVDYFAHMVDIARRNPGTTAWTYTKNYRAVNTWCDENGGKDAIPSNLIVMFSPWDGLPMENPYNFPVFAVKLKKGNKDYTDADFEKMFKCPGKCEICIWKRCGCIGGQNTYADEH